MKNQKTLLIISISILFLLSFIVIGSLSANAATSSSSKCSDSDGGLNYVVKGTVRAINGTNVTYSTDYCLPWGDNTLGEYYCSNGIAREQYYTCENLGPNYICTNGRCATNGTTNQTPTRFKSPTNPPIRMVNTTTCNIWAVPSQGIGPFTSNISARFGNVTDQFPFTATLKCNSNDAGICIPVWLNDQIISRLCNYPQVNIQTIFTASASGAGATCTTSVFDNPRPQTCVDTDGGRNYGVRGITYTNYTQNYTDTCQDNLKLREYWCSGNYVANEIVICRNVGFKKCSLGRCINPSNPTLTEPQTSTKSRFFLWGLLDIFRGKVTGNAVMDRQNPQETNIFNWLVLGVILVAGIMLYNKRQSTSTTEVKERRSETSKSRSQRSRRR